MAKYSIISADAHILEPPDIWQNWLPEKYQDRAPQLVKDRDGGDAWLFAGATEPDPIGLTATPGMPWDQFRWTGVTYDEARPGCYNGAARLADMAEDGVDAEILFPPQRTIGHFLGDEDDDLVLAGVEAYNNFLLEEFCSPDPTRLIGAAQIPSIGIDAVGHGYRFFNCRNDNVCSQDNANNFGGTAVPDGFVDGQFLGFDTGFLTVNLGFFEAFHNFLAIRDNFRQTYVDLL